MLTFSLVLILEAIFIFASQTNPKARQEVDSLVIAILTLFVFSIFWKSIVHAFLSFAGALVTYSGMFFFHTTDFVTQMTDPYVANRLGFGIKHATSISANSIADMYFIVGIFALAFCLAMVFKPNFFKPKDCEDLPYPVWKHKNLEMVEGSGTIRLIPLTTLLTFAEQHIVARFKYVTMIIAGRKYLVSPYDWVPVGSVVVRDEESGFIIGIP